MWHPMPRTRLLISSALTTLLLAGCGQGRGPEASNVTEDIADGSDVEGRVSTCHDGDTCTIKLAGSGDSLKVRMIGIDAPEVSGGEDNQGQPLGQSARTQLNDLIKGKTVRVHAIHHDMYDRMLGEIYLDAKNINVEMLKRGFAEEYVWSNAEVDADAYRAAETYAKSHDLGVWELESYESPSDFRERTRDDH